MLPECDELHINNVKFITLPCLKYGDSMIVKAVYELLAIGATAVSLVIMVFAPSLISLALGSIVIVSSGVLLYRHYMELGTVRMPTISWNWMHKFKTR
jgi:hypothetical protein